MRHLLVTLVLLGGCLGSSRPAVINKLSELPADPGRRDAVLDAGHVEPGPEQKPRSAKARKAETVAATAAAVIGTLLSKSPNVTMGVQVDTEKPRKRPTKVKDGAKAKEDGTEGDDESPPPATDETVEPVRWLRLK